MNTQWEESIQSIAFCHSSFSFPKSDCSEAMENLYSNEAHPSLKETSLCIWYAALTVLVRNFICSKSLQSNFSGEIGFCGSLSFFSTRRALSVSIWKSFSGMEREKVLLRIGKCITGITCICKQ